MNPITKDDPNLTIELFCENEYATIEGNCSAVDPATDKKTAKWIRKQLELNNMWAWCVAHVKVTYKDTLTADDYLGCCSYLGEADFKKGGYFDAMVEVCLDEINMKLKILGVP